MSHTDEGTLHELLDGELDPAEESLLREHLATCAECRGRLDAARATRIRAHEILRYADPLHIDQPDFATVVARRGGSGVASGPVRQAEPARLRPLLLPWAASLVLAVGAGWFAQTLLRGGGAGGERVATMQADEAQMAVADATSEAASVGGEGAAATFRSDPSSVRVARPEPAPSPPPAAMAAPDEAGASQATAVRPAPPQAAAAAEGSFDAAPLAARVADAEDLQQRAAEAPAQWRRIDAAGAAQALGQPPSVIADLQVVSYEAAADGSGMVRITQRLPGGESLELLQRSAAAEQKALAATGEDRAGFAPPPPVAEEVVDARGLEIRLRAPVTADSLRRLADRLR